MSKKRNAKKRRREQRRQMEEHSRLTNDSFQDQQRATSTNKHSKGDGAPPSFDKSRSVNSSSLPTAVDGFGSQKRSIAAIQFVYPERNGRKPYRFQKELLDTFIVPPQEKIEKGLPEFVATNVSLNDILYPDSNREKQSDSGSQLKGDSSQKSPKILHGEHPTNNVVKELRQKNLDVQSLSGQSQGQLSGMSVEDAVRDKLGCRPRANSTDGELNLPQRGLCDERKVLESFKWIPTNVNLSYPKGFVNLGNTCFLNSTVQCLAYLPPFCQSLLSILSHESKHGEKRKTSQGRKVTFILRSLFSQVHGIDGGTTHSGSSLAPRAVVQAVPTLGSCGSRKGYKFRPGRQEDAHEFLVHLLDAMNDGELKEAGINQNASGWRDRLPIPRLDETTFIHRIFGGYFRSQVRCTSCNNRSNTYDPFLNLSLEVSRKACNSVAQALHEFTRKETLDSQNQWKCSGCKKYVCATKQLTVFRPPLSLCIQLKRFTYSGRLKFSVGFGSFGNGGGGQKISKSIEFPAQLKLPLSDGRSCGYSLTGIVIHVGGSASSGHYTAYVRKPGGGSKSQWFHMDDSFVEAVSEQTVLRQRDAYLLFYCREEVKLEFPTPPMSAKEAQELGRAKARARADSLTELQASASTSLITITSKSLCHESTAALEQKRKVNRVEENSNGTVASFPTNLRKQEQNENGDLLEKQRNETSFSAPGKKTDSAELLPTPITAPDFGFEIQRSSVKQFSRRSPDPSKVVVSSKSQLERYGGNIQLGQSPMMKPAIALPDQGEESSSEESSPSDDSSVQDQNDSTSSARISLPVIKSEAKTSFADVSSSSENEEKAFRTINMTESESPHAVQKKALEKPRTRIVLDRGEGREKVEVMMGPRSETKAWTPRAGAVTKSEDYALLGNQRVGRWDDEGDDVATRQHDRGRENLIQQMDKKESNRKRKMYLDRWDAMLDQGQTKKVKEKTDSIEPTTPKKNVFQRIQSSVQRMNRGRAKGHFRPETQKKKRGRRSL
jgi:ubiquitin C-terminal hydrolase